MEPAPLHEPRPARRARASSTSASRGPSPRATRARPSGSARKIRPFVLRRLKKEVAPELPPRVESVLYCELEDRGARRLRRGARGGAQGGGGAARARAAACSRRSRRCSACARRRATRRWSPGSSRTSSAKVERLVEALEDAAADGHKALVFSQWTSLLDLVEPHLARDGIAFERLDGSTRDRGGRGDALPGRRRAARDADLAQGGRDGAEPDGGGPRVPAGSVVEPGGRGPGRGPRPPHRAGQAGDGLPAGGEGHGGGGDPGAAGAEAGARRGGPGRGGAGRRRSRGTICWRCSRSPPLGQASSDRSFHAAPASRPKPSSAGTMAPCTVWWRTSVTRAGLAMPSAISSGVRARGGRPAPLLARSSSAKARRRKRLRRR